jgi:RimJ/RimL family protein N-acetyltransferase
MIEGKYLKMVGMDSSHFDFMLELLNNLEIAKMEGRIEAPLTIEQQKRWFEKQSLNSDFHPWIAIDKEKSIPIGYFSFKFISKIPRIGHIGIKLDPKSQGKGFGNDILRSLSNFYFNKYDIHKLVSHIAEYNIGSQKLFIRDCGWKKEGLLKKTIYHNGEYYDQVLIGLLKSEFQNNEQDDFYNEFIK